MTLPALDAAVHAIMRDAAERAIMPRYQRLGAHEIDAKAADDLVTVADKDAELILAEQLGALLRRLSARKRLTPILRCWTD